MANDNEKVLNLVATVGLFLQGKGKATYAQLRIAHEMLFTPLPWKEVSWEVVRNIANSLTNQLYMAEEADLSQAHMANHNLIGPRNGKPRKFTLEPGRNAKLRSADWDGNGWEAFDEEDVSRLAWESNSSGNGLEAEKRAPGKWEIRFLPAKYDPMYRGTYFGMYDNPEGVKNISFSEESAAIMPPLG